MRKVKQTIRISKNISSAVAFEAFGLCFSIMEQKDVMQAFLEKQ